MSKKKPPVVARDTSFAVYMRVDVCVVVDAADEDDAMMVAEDEIKSALSFTVTGPPTVAVCSVDNEGQGREK